MVDGYSEEGERPAPGDTEPADADPADEQFGALPAPADGPDGGWEGDEEDADPDQHTALPPKVEAWRKRSATGAILTGFALGLQQALEPKRELPSIVVQTSGDPPMDLPVEAEFEFRQPRNSVVNIRPWLLGRDRDAEDEAPDDNGNGDHHSDEEPG